MNEWRDFYIPEDMGSLSATGMYMLLQKQDRPDCQLIWSCSCVNNIVAKRLSHESCDISDMGWKNRTAALNAPWWQVFWNEWETVEDEGFAGMATSQRGLSSMDLISATCIARYRGRCSALTHPHSAYRREATTAKWHDMINGYVTRFRATACHPSSWRWRL